MANWSIDRAKLTYLRKRTGKAAPVMAIRAA